MINKLALLGEWRRLSAILLCIFLLTLTACASTPEQQYTNAQLAYQQQDYHTAFTKLKPLAENNDAKAQYALGFMYYYGIGTNINQQLAMDWIAKAANQGYSPAVAAMHKLQNQGLSKDNNPTFTNI